MGKKRKNEKAATAVTSDGDGEWTVVTSSRRHAAPPKPQPATSSKGADTGARAPSSRQFESSVVSIAVPVKPAPVKEPQSGGGDNKDKSSSSSNKAEGKKTPPPPPAVRVPVPKGMGNPSATLCCMNSVLQALLACEPMRAHNRQQLVALQKRVHRVVRVHVRAAAHVVEAKVLAANRHKLGRRVCPQHVAHRSKRRWFAESVDFLDVFKLSKPTKALFNE